MTFGQLLTSVGIECPSELCGREVSGVFTDSAKVKKNSIFVCIRGDRYDGHDYIDQAIRAGADVIVAENVRGLREGGAALTSVNNTRLCASLLYNEWFGRPSDEMKIIGITGTNGKTSVACMLKAIFEQEGYLCALIGTLGMYIGDTRLGSSELSSSNMTTPDPETLYSALAKMKRSGVDFVFMEVSSHALAQCRTDAIIFDCAVFTNLTVDHLDFHVNMENYYKAKKKLFEQCRRAVINIDDATGYQLASELENSRLALKRCSRHIGDLCALGESQSRPCGIEYIAKSDDGECRVALPNFSGEFTVINSLEAIAAAAYYGITAERAAMALGRMQGVRGRLERVVAHPRQNIEIFIDYAHTPDALERTLMSLRCTRRENSKIILLFGCGGDRDRGKRKEMGAIATRLADLVIISSDNSRSEDPKRIIGDILKGIDKEKEYVVIVDRAEAIRAAICSYAREGDLLLLAGKGHECYEIDAHGAHAFNEKEIIVEVMHNLYG